MLAYRTVIVVVKQKWFWVITDKNAKVPELLFAADKAQIACLSHPFKKKKKTGVISDVTGKLEI